MRVLRRVVLVLETLNSFTDFIILTTDIFLGRLSIEYPSFKYKSISDPGSKLIYAIECFIPYRSIPYNSRESSEYVIADMSKISIYGFGNSCGAFASIFNGDVLRSIQIANP